MSSMPAKTPTQLLCRQPVLALRPCTDGSRQVQGSYPAVMFVLTCEVAVAHLSPAGRAHAPRLAHRRGREGVLQGEQKNNIVNSKPWCAQQGVAEEGSR